jgi:hypothetical protein
MGRESGSCNAKKECTCSEKFLSPEQFALCAAETSCQLNCKRKGYDKGKVRILHFCDDTLLWRKLYLKFLLVSMKKTLLLKTLAGILFRELVPGIHFRELVPAFWYPPRTLNNRNKCSACDPGNCSDSRQGNAHFFADFFLHPVRGINTIENRPIAGK